MLIAIWIFSIVLALFFAAAGFTKAFSPMTEVRKMPWAKEFKDSTIRLIGYSEIVGAVGLVAPLATGILVWLSTLAALCLAILMIGATVTHVRIKDPVSAAVTSAVLASASLALAILSGASQFLPLA
jgi:hypothetical protein